jgi:hypothetical protein
MITTEDPEAPCVQCSMSARRQAIKRRAAALEAADAQRRFQAETLGEEAQPAEGPNQDRFVQQLSGRVRVLQPSFTCALQTWAPKSLADTTAPKGHGHAEKAHSQARLPLLSLSCGRPVSLQYNPLLHVLQPVRDPQVCHLRGGMQMRMGQKVRMTVQGYAQEGAREQGPQGRPAQQQPESSSAPSGGPSDFQADTWIPKR